MIPKSNERKTGAVAGRDRGGLPTRRGGSVHGLGGERPRSDHGNAHQDQLRPQGLAPARQASDRLLEGGIILRRHQAGSHEMQPRGRHARSNGHFGDEEQRHRDEETCERGKVQQQRLPRSRSDGEPFPPGENQKRDPGDSQKRDDPPCHRRVLSTNQADPLHEPISRPTPFDVQFTFVGNCRVHRVISQKSASGTSSSVAARPNFRDKFRQPDTGVDLVQRRIAQSDMFRPYFPPVGSPPTCSLTSRAARRVRSVSSRCFGVDTPEEVQEGGDRPVHPVWWLAPSPAPLSPWKYS